MNNLESYKDYKVNTYGIGVKSSDIHFGFGGKQLTEDVLNKYFFNAHSVENTHAKLLGGEYRFTELPDMSVDKIDEFFSAIYKIYYPDETPRLGFKKFITDLEDENGYPVNILATNSSHGGHTMIKMSQVFNINGKEKTKVFTFELTKTGGQGGEDLSMNSADYECAIATKVNSLMYFEAHGNDDGIPDIERKYLGNLNINKYIHNSAAITIIAQKALQQLKLKFPGFDVNDPQWYLKKQPTIDTSAEWLASDKTPKTDVISENGVIKLSFKDFRGYQLMSGQLFSKNDAAETTETWNTFNAAFDKCGMDENDELRQKISSILMDIDGCTNDEVKQAKDRLRKTRASIDDIKYRRSVYADDDVIYNAYTLINSKLKELQNLLNRQSKESKFIEELCREAALGEVKFGNNDGTANSFFMFDVINLFDTADNKTEIVYNNNIDSTWKEYWNEEKNNIKFSVRFKSSNGRIWTCLGIVCLNDKRINQNSLNDDEVSTKM